MDQITIIRAEAQRFADVLAAADPDARCPTCPEWSAADLLWHLTSVHFFWAGVLARNARTEADITVVEQAKPDRPDAMSDLLALREQATTALLVQLGRIDDAEPDKFMLPRTSDMRYNWIDVRLDAIDLEELRELVIDAWRMCVPKKVAAELSSD